MEEYTVRPRTFLLGDSKLVTSKTKDDVGKAFCPYIVRGHRQYKNVAWMDKRLKGGRYCVLEDDSSRRRENCSKKGLLFQRT